MGEITVKTTTTIKYELEQTAQVRIETRYKTQQQQQ